VESIKLILVHFTHFGFEEQRKHHKNSLLQLHETVVRDQPWEQDGMTANDLIVIVFECSVRTEVEPDQDRNDLRIGHSTGAVAMFFRAGEQLALKEGDLR